MKTKTLFEQVNMVETEDDFIEFLQLLAIDRRNSKCNSEKNDWNNGAIETFFECSYEWAKSSKNGLRFYDKPDNIWKRCAQILYMGKVYE